MANNVFKKVLDGVNDPQKNNPDHIRQQKRDKEKEYRALTLPKPLSEKEEHNGRND